MELSDTKPESDWRCPYCHEDCTQHARERDELRADARWLRDQITSLDAEVARLKAAVVEIGAAHVAAQAEAERRRSDNKWLVDLATHLLVRLQATGGAHPIEIGVVQSELEARAW